jgi:hypothetical protein
VSRTQAVALLDFRAATHCRSVRGCADYVTANTCTAIGSRFLIEMRLGAAATGEQVSRAVVTGLIDPVG